jgi:hypothetical protein
MLPIPPSVSRVSRNKPMQGGNFGKPLLLATHNDKNAGGRRKHQLRIVVPAIGRLTPKGG